MEYIDYEDDLLLDDEEYERREKQRTKERSERLNLEAQPYLKDEMRTSWQTNIIWNNEVMRGRKLLSLVGALNLIELYNKGESIEEIYGHAHLFGEIEYQAMLADLVKYFKQGKELQEQLLNYHPPVRSL